MEHSSSGEGARGATINKRGAAQQASKRTSVCSVKNGCQCVKSKHGVRTSAFCPASAVLPCDITVLSGPPLAPCLCICICMCMCMCEHYAYACACDERTKRANQKSIKTEKKQTNKHKQTNKQKITLQASSSHGGAACRHKLNALVARSRCAAGRSCS